MGTNPNQMNNNLFNLTRNLVALSLIFLILHGNNIILAQESNWIEINPSLEGRQWWDKNSRIDTTEGNIIINTRFTSIRNKKEITN